MPEFWEVRVTGPEGQTEEGGVDIWEHTFLEPEEIAEYLVDIVRDIVLDMARGGHEPEALRYDDVFQPKGRK